MSYFLALTMLVARIILQSDMVDLVLPVFVVQD
jgi:hypothetical protein